MEINRIYTLGQVQQSLIQFACRTATHQPFSVKQNEDLKEALKSKYPERFQRFESNPQLVFKLFVIILSGPLLFPFIV